MTAGCCVCFETYVWQGDRCPKLLPCSHTICLQCLGKLVVEEQVQCPECRECHQVPSQGTQAFPTNRYVLENIELAERNAKLEGMREQTICESMVGSVEESIQPSAPPMETTEIHFEAEICEIHNLPFEMFCFEVECGRPLCPSCRMGPKHKDHDFEYANGQTDIIETSRDEARSTNTNQSADSSTHSQTVINDGITLSANSSVGITQSSFPSRNTKTNKKRGGSSDDWYRRKCCKCCAIFFALVFFWVIAAFLLIIFL